jgi:hypothetical protein
MCCVRFGSFRDVVRGVLVMTASGARMVGGLFMGACLMVLGRFVVMVRGLFVVIRGVTMMASCFVGHRGAPIA